MIRTGIFLTMESLALSIGCLIAWLLLTHSLRRLGAAAPRCRMFALPILWLVMLIINAIATQIWGPPFTALYTLTAFALAVGITVFFISFILKAPRRSRP